MSQAEMTARSLYDSMNLSNVSDEVKRHLMILLLTSAEDRSTTIQIPETLLDAHAMGAMDLETARTELHAYADKLS